VINLSGAAIGRDPRLDGRPAGIHPAGRLQGILWSLPAGAIGVEAPGIALFQAPVGTADSALIP